MNGMLSEETAIGKYPVEAVDMMVRIALSIEREMRSSDLCEYYRALQGHQQASIEDVLSFNVVDAVRALDIRCIVTPTQNGSTARRISRFNPVQGRVRVK